jgi:hypothetical protein
MRSFTSMAAVAVLFAGSTQVLAKPMAKHAAFQLNETTWTYTYKGKHTRESIDADGNFISTVKGKKVDHGTTRMKDDKACFTSAVDTKDGEVCWTTKPVEIGHSMVTHNDKGHKLTVTRVKYVAMK